MKKVFYQKAKVGIDGRIKMREEKQFRYIFLSGKLYETCEQKGKIHVCC